MRSLPNGSSRAAFFADDGTPGRYQHWHFMIDLPLTLDLRDLFYVLVDLALLGLTLQSALAHIRWLNIPAFYVLTGIAAAAWGLPTLTPLGSELEAKILAHLVSVR